MSAKHQTLTDFYASPFKRGGQLVKQNNEYYETYRKYRMLNKLTVYGVCQIGESFYFHIKVPSESKSDKKYEYDVVVKFYTDDPKVASQTHLRNYYVKFFSNCPSFIYKYAYIYKQEGYLIEELYNKLDKDYINVPPSNTNPNLETAYDKSLFCVIRFLLDLQYRYLDKKGPILHKKVTPNRFFSRISDFRSIKIDQYLINEEKKLKKNLEKEKNKRGDNISSKKEKTSSTTKTKSNRSSITVKSKITGKSHIKGKKKPTSSTKRQ